MEIELPDGTVLDAPNDADPSAVAKAYLAKRAKPDMTQGAKTSDPSLYSTTDRIKNMALDAGKQTARAVGLTGRTLLNAVASPALMAADAGVAGRNLLTGSNYDNASQMWNQGLDSAGVPKPTGAWEKGVDVVGQAMIGSKLPSPSIANPAPAGFNPQTMQQIALQKAQQQGYVVPPSTVNPSPLNKTLESIGGKIATEQDASLRNQSVTDQLVKSDLGLKPSAQVSEDVLPGMRTAAGGPYNALRSAGQITATPAYDKALDDLAAPHLSTAKDFPKLARTDILDAVEGARSQAFDANSAVDTIVAMRESAGKAYQQGDKALGKAYKGIANAMEDAVETDLGSRGKDGVQMLKEFRDARQLIAKTYSAGASLNPQTGSFNAQKLATQLAKGKPLSGDMKKAAEFAQAFPKAAKLVLDSGSVRNTDVVLGAGTAIMSKEPAYLMYPFARQAVRAGLLSNAGQRILTQPGMAPAPQTAMGILYGSNSLRE